MDAYIFRDGLCCEACAERARAGTTIRRSASLQRLPPGTDADCKVVNETVLGERIARVAERMVGDAVATVGSAYQEGGCLVFAKALSEWSEGALHVRGVEALGLPGKARHVVADLDGRVFIDSDGIGTAADVIAKMDRFESPGRYILTEGEPSSEALEGIHHDDALTARVAVALKAALGPFDREGFEGMKVLAFDPDDERTFDSKDYPKGPYPDGGGLALTPQNCESCGAFLENPLTPEGEAYVFRKVRLRHGEPEELAEWRAFYDHLFPSLDEDEEVGLAADEFAPSP